MKKCNKIFDIMKEQLIKEISIVERFIDKHSGEFRKRELSKKLSKKITWKNFKEIIKHLEINYKIVYDRYGYIGYIYHPEIVKKYKRKKDLEWKPTKN
jgi:hypothetical protein